MYKHAGRWNKQTRENCKRRGGKTDGETDSRSPINLLELLASAERTEKQHLVAKN